MIQYLLFGTSKLLNISDITKRIGNFFQAADSTFLSYLLSRTRVALPSYISTLLTMSLAMGLVFEIPMLAWLFAKLGFLSAPFMRHYRRHAIVLILVVAAIITPTSDVFTLSLVALPMWLLYEASIFIVKRTNKPTS